MASDAWETEGGGNGLFRAPRPRQLGRGCRAARAINLGTLESSDGDSAQAGRLSALAGGTCSLVGQRHKHLI